MQIKTGVAQPNSLVRSAPSAASAKVSVSPAEVGSQAGDQVALASDESVADAPVGVLSGDSGQRIGHFVRSVTQESLQHVRYLAGAAAFRNVGSAVGSLTLTPLAIKLAEGGAASALNSVGSALGSSTVTGWATQLAGNSAAVVGGLAIGGTVAAGALGGLLGYMWLRNSDDGATKEFTQPSKVGKAVDLSLDVASGLKALPNFIYPTIYGATEAQRENIYAALDQLPLSNATASATMTVVPDLVGTGISGMSQPGSSHVRILLDSGYLNDADKARDLVFHENGHAVDYSGGFGLLGSNNWKAGFGKGPFISDYAGSNRYEDWADTYEHFHNNPADVTARFPEKAEAIARASQQNPLSQAADTPRVREAGKNIGEALGKVPYLRDGLELASSLVGPVQMYRGAGDLIEGFETDDEGKKLRGKLNLASGLFLSLPGAAPLALASSLAGATLKAVASDDNPEAMKTANTWATRILATSAGPVGVTIAAVQGELSANGLTYDDSQGFSAQGWKNSRPDRSYMLRGTIATVGGAVGGSLAGAAIGAALAGRTGAAVGGVWGQLAGSALGLGAYGVARALHNGKKDNNPLALTGGDKKFLGGLVGGALVGGAAGTGLGTYGGKALGEFVGNLVAGPSGGALLGTVGGWSGALIGAYGGAKLGSAAGSGRLFGKQPTMQTLARPKA